MLESAAPLCKWLQTGLVQSQPNLFILTTFSQKLDAVNGPHIPSNLFGFPFHALYKSKQRHVLCWHWSSINHSPFVHFAYSGSAVFGIASNCHESEYGYWSTSTPHWGHFAWIQWLSSIHRSQMYVTTISVCFYQNTLPILVSRGLCGFGLGSARFPIGWQLQHELYVSSIHMF